MAGEHLAHILLGVVAPVLLLALVAVHFATRAGGGRPVRTYKLAAAVYNLARLDREERGRQRSIRAHARDLASGPAQLTATLVDPPAFDDTTDDAVPVDMAAVMAEQDAEEGREFVAKVERHLRLSTAVTFGFVYLPDIRRAVRSGAPR